jgi:hypothetical protein
MEETEGPGDRIHTLFVEQNQGLFKDFPGQKLVFKHLFLSIFIYKTLLNLIFLQVKMPVPSQENDGCPMSDLDHFQFKMPGKCKFLNKWLEQPQYHAWLRNSPDIYKTHCKCCNKSFDISSMTLLNLIFLQVKMPVPSQENDGCQMSVVGNVKTFVAALCKCITLFEQPIPEEQVHLSCNITPRIALVEITQCKTH